MAHKTLVNGTAYEISGGKTLVNGTAYGIKNGQTLVGGTAYGVEFCTPIGSLPVGKKVFLNVAGESREFIIVHQGLPSSKYDNSCDGTWLLQNFLYEQSEFGTNSTCEDYEHSIVHTYLNDTFFNMLDSNVQSAVKQVKIPYWKGRWNNGSLALGADGLSTKIFLLDASEVGVLTDWFVDNIYSIFPEIGSCLNYFVGTSEQDDKRSTFFLSNYSGGKWWLRTPTATSNTTVCAISIFGSLQGNSYASNYALRPALILDPMTDARHLLR